MKNEAAKKKVVERLLKAQKITIMTHEGADADGIGCEIALGSALERLGKKVLIMNNEPVIGKFRFLDPRNKITVYSGKREGEFKNSDLIVLLDTCEVRRTGKASDVLKKYTHKITYIDHHQPQPGDDEYNDMEGVAMPEASSAGEIVLDVIEMMPVEMDLQLASPLLAAIIFDTLSFRYIRNNPSPLLKSAKLIALGADATAIQTTLFSSKRKDFLILLGRALEKMQFMHGDRLACSAITKEMTEDITVDRDDLRSVITYLIEIGSVEAAVIFKETEDRKIKVSMRAKNSMSILSIAQKFGGGGHHQAAGCDLDGSLDEVKEKILKEFEAKFFTCS
ncbi:MAG: DHH family phosphoesterase [Deltaproteobacteria bacterium]|nr:DHH family phosphoesterase [Deltaproteobacteria bacterium]